MGEKASMELKKMRDKNQYLISEFDKLTERAKRNELILK
jgi:uncharacterized protein YigA (DUF484 family)